MPNLKSLWLFCPFPGARERFLSKCTVLKVDLLPHHQRDWLMACRCTLFSPEILQAGAVKGLNVLSHIKTAIACQCLARIIAVRRVNKRMGLHPARDSCDRWLLTAWQWVVIPSPTNKLINLWNCANTGEFIHFWLVKIFEVGAAKAYCIQPKLKELKHSTVLWLVIFRAQWLKLSDWMAEVYVYSYAKV